MKSVIFICNASLLVVRYSACKENSDKLIKARLDVWPQAGIGRPSGLGGAAIHRDTKRAAQISVDRTAKSRV